MFGIADFGAFVAATVLFLAIPGPGNLALTTLGAMATTVAVLTLVYGLGATLLTHFLAERLRANPQIGRALEKAAGVCLIGFGIKLAITK